MLFRSGLHDVVLDIPKLQSLSEGFTGAEIEQAVVSAMYSAAAEGREVDQGALAAALQQTQPLSVLHYEQIQSLRNWASERAVKA